MSKWSIVIETADGTRHYEIVIALNYTNAVRRAKNKLNARGIKDKEMTVLKVLNLSGLDASAKK